MHSVAKSNIPIYKEGVRAGYDTASRRYRDVDGNILSKNVFRAVQNLPSNTEGFGWSAKPLLRSPVSEAFEKYDLLLTGARRLEEIITYEDRKKLPAAQPIPSDIRAAMNLAEFYCKTEGDVFQHIEAPIDVSVNDIEINCPDTGLKRDLGELYSQDFLDMWEVLYQAWMCTAQYGTSFPLEVYDKAQKEPQKIILLPPRFVWVGYYVSYGEHVGGMISPYALNPLDESQKWTEDLVNTTIMPMTYNSFSPQWNEQIMKGAGIPLDPRFLKPIRAKAYDFNRYPQPPLSRAYRAISTRVVFEEMVRATIEGYRNQLWVFLLGTSEHPPSPQEMAALKATLEGMAGERTGYLAWRGDLTVEQHTPKPLEQMLSNDTFQAFTMQIFRMMGANVRVVTGNPLMGERADSSMEVDLSLWLKRLEFMRTKVLRWEQAFRSAYVRRQNSTAMTKANEKTTVRFSRSLLEVSDLIEKELRPLYSLGLLSRRTPVEKAGYNFDQELAYKKDEKKDEALFLPPPAFNQTTMSGNGASRDTSQSLPAGRPPDNVNPNQLKAALIDEPMREKLYAEVYAAFREMMLASDRAAAINAFIAKLREIDERQLTTIAQQAYTASGGIGEIPIEWAGLAAQFVNSFASGFEQALLGALAQGEPLDKFLYRAMLYPQEGYKMAVINGQSYAMRERGARHWRRVLHPELTQGGPCELCVADSLILHAIEEPFIVLHPNEACSKQDLWIQYFTGGIPSIEVPIPASPSGFDEYAKALGKLGKAQTRRKRV